MTDKRSCRDCINCRFEPLGPSAWVYSGRRPATRHTIRRRVWCRKGHWDGREMNTTLAHIFNDTGENPSHVSPILMLKRAGFCQDYD
jgi:hypothetical protein